MEEDNPELQIASRKHGDGHASRGFRQGFGFTLGVVSALIVVVALVALALYIAVLGGLVTWEEILLF